MRLQTQILKNLYIWFTLLYSNNEKYKMNECKYIEKLLQQQENAYIE